MVRNPGPPSWDQTSLLSAVRGLSFEGEVYWTAVTTGSNVIATNGANEWQASPDKNHSYLVKAMEPASVAEVIEELMVQAPM